VAFVVLGRIYRLKFFCVYEVIILLVQFLDCYVLLPDEKQAVVRKMSSVRLANYLVEGGFDL
jgi:hypothetical protein